MCLGILCGINQCFPLDFGMSVKNVVLTTISLALSPSYSKQIVDINLSCNSMFLSITPLGVIFKAVIFREMRFISNGLLLCNVDLTVCK